MTRRVSVLLLGVLLASSCGGAGPNNPPSSPPTASTTSPATTASTAMTVPEQSDSTAADDVVLASYVAAMDAYTAAVADPPNPEDPTLADHVMDPLLTEFRNTATQWKGFGQAVRYPDPTVHRTELISVEVDGDRAALEVCSVDDSILYEPATGRVLNDDVSTNHIRATLVLDGDQWLLSERERVEQWEGVAGCAA